MFIYQNTSNFTIRIGDFMASKYNSKKLMKEGEEKKRGEGKKKRRKEVEKREEEEEKEEEEEENGVGSIKMRLVYPFSEYLYFH